MNDAFLPKLFLLSVHNMPILEQLQLEESLLRTREDNFFLFNEGSIPAIILGISGNVDLLVHKEKTAEQNIPLIRRFSGGGTVVVDENTLFTTFIMNKKDLDISPYPEPIMRWTALFFQKALQIKGFGLRENDYAIHHKKCGGNAQYIQKNRWLHHSTFLWDYESTRMECLLHPPKTPPYRAGRDHLDFLTTLKEHIPRKSLFKDSIIAELEKRFNVIELKIQDVVGLSTIEHRKTTALLS